MTSELELGQRVTNQLSLLLVDTEVVEKPTKEETVVENATPDYAAGLVSTQVGLPCSAAMDTFSCQNNILHLVLIASR